MNWLIWLCFFAIFIGVLALDLGVLHREAKVMHVRQALGWTLVWVVVALSFAGLVYGVYEYQWFGWHAIGEDPPDGAEAAIQYVTGYLLEWSLSVDNIFVIAIIFTFMKIPTQFQYRVLFWGIIGAIVLRGAMIAAGAALIHSFDWTFYLFGAILLFSAARMLRSEEEQFDPGKSVLVRIARRVYPVTDKLDGERFFTHVDGARATHGAGACGRRDATGGGRRQQRRVCQLRRTLCLGRQRHHRHQLRGNRQRHAVGATGRWQRARDSRCGNDGLAL